MAVRVIKTQANASALRAIEREQQRWQGELAFEVDGYSAAVYELAFNKEVPQAPLVFYTIQSNSPDASVTNSYLIKRDGASCQILLENNHAAKVSGVIMYLAFIRQP